MSTELVELRDKPLSKDQLLAQVRTVQDVMKAVMKNGEHYGVVPGCGNKLTLLKPGAEKLLMTFGFSTKLDVEDMFPGDEDKVGYRVTCEVYTRDGRLMGSGVGEASSEEEKWKWREALCQEQWDEALDDERRKKWKKNYGKIETILQIKNHPYDLSNTILKMAKKRAQVDATLTVCACSDIFAQDLEEMAENGQAPRQAQSQAKASSVPRTPKYGAEPDVPLTECSTKHLQDYAESIDRSLMIDDPQEIFSTDTAEEKRKKEKHNDQVAKKLKFKGKNEKDLEAIITELEARKTQEAKAANEEHPA